MYRVTGGILVGYRVTGGIQSVVVQSNWWGTEYRVTGGVHSNWWGTE